MKKGTKFLTGLLTASITFGALMFTLGPDSFNKYGKHRAACYSEHMHHCDHGHHSDHHSE